LHSGYGAFRARKVGMKLQRKQQPNPPWSNEATRWISAKRPCNMVSRDFVLPPDGSYLIFTFPGCASQLLSAENVASCRPAIHIERGHGHHASLEDEGDDESKGGRCQHINTAHGTFLTIRHRRRIFIHSRSQHTCENSTSGEQNDVQRLSTSSGRCVLLAAPLHCSLLMQYFRRYSTFNCEATPTVTRTSKYSRAILLEQRAQPIRNSRTTAIKDIPGRDTTTSCVSAGKSSAFIADGLVRFSHFSPLDARSKSRSQNQVLFKVSRSKHQALMLSKRSTSLRYHASPNLQGDKTIVPFRK